MPAKPPEVYVCQQWLQLLFNQNYLTRVKDGELREEIVKSRPATGDIANEEPPDTLSQTVLYHDTAGSAVAKAHQYMRADGKLGASGLPDPKVIIHDGIKYCLHEECGCDTEGGGCPHVARGLEDSPERERVLVSELSARAQPPTQS